MPALPFHALELLPDSPEGQPAGLRVAAGERQEHPEISATLVDLVSLQPWDKEAVSNAVKASGKVVVLYEDTFSSSFGAEVAAWINENCFEYLDAPVMRCGSLDTAIPMSKVLEDDFLAKARLGEVITKLLSY